ncbi:MAG: DNA translocase FtsK, partial [Planctomycetota bacterium]
VIVTEQRGSVSLLQRKLSIGYTRAARLVDEMEKCGVVGKHTGSSAREVLLTLEQWEGLKAGAQAD